MFITFTIIFNVFFFEVLFQISSLHTSPPRDDVLTCSSKITLNSFQSHIRWLMEAARDSIKGCSAVRSVQQRVRTGERAGGMLVCSLVTMRVAVGGGRGGGKVQRGQRQMADSRDCIMHPRVGETPTPTPPRSMHGNVPGFSRNIRGSWNLWWKGDRDTHTMCFHSSIMNNCDVQRASFQA